MKRSIALWQVIGFAFVSLGGTLLHYLYGWMGESPVIAVISGINESTWEHMKLLFVPMLLFAWIQHLLFPEKQNFWCVKAVGVLFGTVMIPVLFYTANGAFGQTPDWLNISFFFVAVAMAFLLEWWLFRLNAIPCKHSYLAWTLLIGVAVLFAAFTFTPPEIPLFRDPATGTYGI